MVFGCKGTAESRDIKVANYKSRKAFRGNYSPTLLIPYFEQHHIYPLISFYNQSQQEWVSPWTSHADHKTSCITTGSHNTRHRQKKQNPFTMLNSNTPTLPLI